MSTAADIVGQETAGRIVPVVQMVGHAILAGCPGDFPYRMPREMLPIMDCQNCQWMNFRGEEEAKRGLHCYMFMDPPAGDRCGQMKPVKGVGGT